MKVNINQKIKDFASDKIEDLKTVDGDLSLFVGDKIRPKLCEKCKGFVKESKEKEKTMTLRNVLIDSLYAAYKDDAILNKEGKIIYNVTPEDGYNKFLIGRKIAWATERKKPDIDLSSDEIRTAKKAIGRKYLQSPMVMGQAWDMLEGTNELKDK